MQSATARFTSTTGEPVSPSQLLVQVGYAYPVGGLRCLSSGVAGRDPSLERVLAKLGPDRLRPFQSGQAAHDVHRIPARPVLIKQQDRRPVLSHARCQARRLQLHER
jgi:hypothetical protein